MPPFDPSPTLANWLAILLRNQMGGEQDQVVIYNQAWKLPPDKRWYLVIAYLAGAPYAYSKRYLDTPTTPDQGLVECQSVNVRETYTFTLFSETSEARLRMNDIHFALNSDEAERMMAKHAFRIANLPVSFVDVSEVEATARLNRYESTVNILTVHTRQRNTPFFDKFTVPPEILVNA